MTIRRVVAFAVLSLFLGVVSGANDAHAGVYAGTKCVSDKLKTSGKHCKAVLKAWSKWDKDQDNTKRDGAITAAVTKFTERWALYETKAADKGAECAETTLSSGDMNTLIGGAVDAIVADVNGALDLVGNDADKKCGAAILKAAANKCQAFLKAESKHLKILAKDPQGLARADAQAAASAKFSLKFASAVAGGCSTTATDNSVETAVDDLSGDVLQNSIVSPNVDDTQFTTISPTGSVEYEGRSFAAICSDESPYHFFVKRGTVNKLLMYYQGGGACWNQVTCGVVGTCDPDVNPAGSDNPNNVSVGFADRTNPLNPFKDWHAVFVSYCTCDIHWGDADRTYAGNPPVSIEHKGYVNAKVAEKWAREHFVNPDEVFVTGSSAGAYGATLHGTLLHNVYPASDINVLADAGNGVITPDFLTNNFPQWNVEPNLPTYIPGIGPPITDLSIPELFNAVGAYYPNTNWAHYTTAYDGSSGGQSGFYNVMQNPNDVLQWLRWWDATCEWNDIMVDQANEVTAPNYRYYIGTGSRHTMFGSNKVYTDTTGGVPTIVDWINDMRADAPGWVNVTASNFGLLLPGDPVDLSTQCLGGGNDGAACSNDSECPGGDCTLQPPFTQVGPDIVIDCTP